MTNKKSYKGRNCCRKIDYKFNKIESDLHNLVPSVGTINRIRSNYDFTDEKNLSSSIHGCNIKYDRKKKLFTPPEHARGMIARIYLYMARKYHISLEPEQRQLFIKWHEMHPPRLWEVKRNEIIRKVQGDSNTYTDWWVVKDSNLRPTG